MSEARQLFLAALRQGIMFAPGNEAAHDSLSHAARLWREEGRHFSAGYAMSHAIRSAWGDPTRMAAAQDATIVDFQEAVKANGPDSLEGLAALHKLRGELSQLLWLFQVDRSKVEGSIREVDEELAQRLLTYFADPPHADDYLVRGVQLSTDLESHWEVGFLEYEVPLGSEAFGDSVLLNLPSAFRLFATAGDYLGAYAIAQRRPDAFTSPGLRGWKAAVCAFVEPERAVELFDESADAFAQDVLPENPSEAAEKVLAKRGGFWSGINTHLWAKYFRARARVLQAIREPDRVRELMQAAVAALQGTESGWHSGDVSRFGIVVGTLAKLISDPDSLDAESARQGLLFEGWISGHQEQDAPALSFLQYAAEAFKGFRADPEAELTRGNLASAVDALGRIPLIGPQVAGALSPALGKSAYAQALGPFRTWVHRTLEGVSDEKQLRRLLLRLLQAALPQYSQIRHGPLEYGKDVVTLVEENGRKVLRMYQVKCGEIDKRKWREARDELEEIFQVAIPELLLPTAPDVIEGVLVSNGHANPYVEPVMQAWLVEQREKMGRNVQFMHLDRLVAWIFEKRLMNDLKAAMKEVGLDPIVANS